MRWVRSNRSAGVWLVLALIVVGFLDGNRAWSGPVELGGEVAHEEAPSDPWMPRSGEIPPGVQVRCEPVVLGPYKSVQVNVDEFGCNIPGDAANEPSIAIDPANPRRIVIGWRQFDTVESDFRQAGWGYSHDGGHTWAFAGVLRQGVFGSDPVLDSDLDGNLYYHTIRCPNDGCGDFFKSTDGGLTWHGPVPTNAGDKPWMVVDRTAGPGSGNIYILHGNLARSVDGGESFAQWWVYTMGDTLTVGSMGEVYFSTWRVSYNYYDPSMTPTVTYLPGIILGYGYGGSAVNPAGLIGQEWVVSDTSSGPLRGALYVLSSVRTDFSGGYHQIKFARSLDGGWTWSEPVRVNDDPPDAPAYHWFGMLSLAPNGRLDAVWNDTRNSSDYRFSELYYAYSEDGGETWQGNIPVSPPFNTHLGWPGLLQHKIGDYYHMWSDNLGVNVAYAATFNGEQDVYFLRIGAYDCNGNEIPDENDMVNGTSLDCNEDEVPDECEYRGDFNGDRLTALDDYFAYTQCRTAPGVEFTTPCCGLFDIEPNGDVDLADFAFVQRAFAGQGP